MPTPLRDRCGPTSASPSRAPGRLFHRGGGRHCARGGDGAAAARALVLRTAHLDRLSHAQDRLSADHHVLWLGVYDVSKISMVVFDAIFPVVRSWTSGALRPWKSDRRRPAKTTSRRLFVRSPATGAARNPQKSRRSLARGLEGQPTLRPRRKSSRKEQLSG